MAQGWLITSQPPSPGVNLDLSCQRWLELPRQWHWKYQCHCQCAKRRHADLYRHRHHCCQCDRKLGQQRNGLRRHLARPTQARTTTMTATPLCRKPTSVLLKTGPAQIVPGSSVTYTITVKNAGPSNAESVDLSDPTPAGLVFVSNTGDCTTAFPCSFGILAPNAPKSLPQPTQCPADFDPSGIGHQHRKHLESHGRPATCQQHLEHHRRQQSQCRFEPDKKPWTTPSQPSVRT